MSVRNIEDLAMRFSAELGGIPWEDLEREHNKPVAAIVMDYYSTEEGSTVPGDAALGYIRVIMDAMRRANEISKTLDLSRSLSSPQAKQAWDNVKNDSMSVSKAALDSFKKDFYSVLPSGEGVKINVEDLRATVSSIFITAIYGAEVQASFALQKAGMHPDKIAEHAQLVTQSFNLIDFFDQNGLLDGIKKAEFRPAPGEKTKFQRWVEESVSGLGVAVTGPMIVGLVLVGVALIAGICWAMIAMQKVSATNKVLLDVCDKSLQTGAPKDVAACRQLMTINNVTTDNGPSFGTDQITTWLLVGAAGYLLFLFGPSIAATVERRADRKARQA